MVEALEYSLVEVSYRNEELFGSQYRLLYRDLLVEAVMNITRGHHYSLGGITRGITRGTSLGEHH